MSFFDFFVTAVPEVSPNEAYKRMQAGAQLVDVREDAEWRLGHAAGALHIPLGLLDQQSSLAKISPDKPVLVICAHGNRSRIGTKILAGAGYTASSVAGGTVAWEQAGLPMK